MPPLGQTVAVIDKSGKVVSTSKHLFGVFKEARNAYRERKAELKSDEIARKEEREARRALAAYTIQDSPSIASSARRSKSVVRHSEHPRNARTVDHSHRRRSYIEQDLHSNTHTRHSSRRPHQELARRHTSHDLYVSDRRPAHPGTRSHSTPHVDMDLAYGDFHPESLERMHKKELSKEEEVSGLVSKVKMLLREADCAQHSVSATIAHLQKHPDAMAAVALTLAEISNLVTKMAPAALAALKTSAPGVFALLASPQFMVAAGVGIGVTIVMFGGYKIVKQIKTAQAAKQGSVDEMLELNSSVSRVETWRRGVADYEAASVGTSVDGEFITPTAAAMSGMLPRPHDRVSELRSGTRGLREVDGPEDSASQFTRTTRSSRRSRRSKAASRAEEADSKKKSSKKKKDKTKKPSPLRLLFR